MPHEDAPKKRRPPARSLEAREDQLINLAVDLAEEQLRAGTASTQVIVHYLKLATTREQLEKEKIIHENALLKAKTDSIDNTAKGGEFYERVIKALKTYKGIDDDSEDAEDF